jgi:transposase
MTASAAVPSEGRGAMSTTTQADSPKSVLQYIGALPIINRVIERLELKELLSAFVPADKRDKVFPAITLLLLLRNLLIVRRPLYKIPPWAKGFVPSLLGLPQDAEKYLNDDRIGRSLDRLFRADFRSLITKLAVTAVVKYGLDLSQIHNDATASRHTGEYPDADGSPAFNKETHRITHGHPKKDGRPDLKQLLYVLTTTADGCVPIYVSIDHGNTADVKTHIPNWKAIRRVTKTPDFLYVTDCKLCSEKNMTFIDRNGGRFLSVLPANWLEYKQFHELIRTHDVAWEDVATKKSIRRKTDPPIKYRGYEAPDGLRLGFRLLWFWSSEKEANDRATRDRKIQRAEAKLQAISKKIGKKGSQLTSKEKIMEKAQKVLRKYRVEQWLKVDVDTTETEQKKKTGPGRPGPNSTYVTQKKVHYALRWNVDALTLQLEARSDGIFPLTTNDKKLSMLEALDAYKGQPMIEKRFQQLKSVFNLRPVLLQNHLRVEAFLVVYFLVLLVETLIEREARNLMEEHGIKELPIYAEGKPCKAPTASAIFQALEGVHRVQLSDKYGRVIGDFNGEVNDAQLAIMDLFGISAKEYLTV